jgi:hypothetical protein
MIAVLYAVFIAFLFLTPPTPRASKSELFGEIKKDSLLINQSPPRIIFVGGSNLRFGLNSQMIKDSLALNPINTAIGVGNGIKYMLDNTLQYIQSGDIIVIVPEYEHFYKEWDAGSTYLLHTIFDVNKSKAKLLSLRQAINCIPFVGKFVFSRLKISEYIKTKEERESYGMHSFNQYGDTDVHWGMPRQNNIFPLDKLVVENYNPQVMTEIKNYTQKIQEKGASIYISYPGLQDVSFLNSEKAIKKVEREYIASGLILLGTPERYEMPDSLLFDYPYHLIKMGVDRRTQLLIEDLRKQFNQEETCEEN